MWLCCLVVRQNTLPNVAQSYKKKLSFKPKNRHKINAILFLHFSILPNKFPVW